MLTVAYQRAAEETEGKRREEKEKEEEEKGNTCSLTKGELFLSSSSPSVLYTASISLSPLPFSCSHSHHHTPVSFPCELKAESDEKGGKGREGERCSRRFCRNLRRSTLTVVIEEDFNTTAFGHSEERRLRSDVKASDSHCEYRI